VPLAQVELYGETVKFYVVQAAEPQLRAPAWFASVIKPAKKDGKEKLSTTLIGSTIVEWSAVVPTPKAENTHSNMTVEFAMTFYFLAMCNSAFGLKVCLGRLLSLGLGSFREESSVDFERPSLSWLVRRRSPESRYTRRTGFEFGGLRRFEVEGLLPRVRTFAG
jgi:hypothetical protein